MHIYYVCLSRGVKTLGGVRWKSLVVTYGSDDFVFARLTSHEGKKCHTTNLNRDDDFYALLVFYIIAALR